MCLMNLYSVLWMCLINLYSVLVFPLFFKSLTFSFIKIDIPCIIMTILYSWFGSLTAVDIYLYLSLFLIRKIYDILYNEPWEALTSRSEHGISFTPNSEHYVWKFELLITALCFIEYLNTHLSSFIDLFVLLLTNVFIYKTLYVYICYINLHILFVCFF